MGHYDEQREAQIQSELEAQEEEEYLKRTASLCDYEHYVNGKEIDAALDELVAQSESMGGYDKDDMYNYSEIEFFDFLEVLRMGAKKHGNLNWLQPNGKTSNHRDMHASMFRHLASSYANDRIDKESGLDHLLHLASRSLMYYTILKRGIKHVDDKEL